VKPNEIVVKQSKKRQEDRLAPNVPPTITPTADGAPIDADDDQVMADNDQVLQARSEDGPSTNLNTRQPPPNRPAPPPKPKEASLFIPKKKPSKVCVQVMSFGSNCIQYLIAETRRKL
jgi:hypothetical protein